MDQDNQRLDELSKDVQRVLEDNKKFLERVLDDDFEPDEEIEDDTPFEEEL